MKKKIDVFEHMGEILNGVKNGVLITGKADGRVNSMTISWGMVGVNGENQFLLHLSEKVVLQGVFLRRMANLRLIFHWMTVQKKFLDTVGQNQEGM